MKLGVRGVHVGVPLTALVILFHATGCATRQGGGSATVEFRQPQQFSDLQLPGTTRERTAELVLPRLQEELSADARQSIPAGYQVQIVITEIDQPGVIPNPGAAFPIRITSDNSAAVVGFDYTVQGADGSVVRSGSQRLVQVPEDLGPFLDDDSPVPLIEYMINNWLGSLGWELSHSRK